MAKILYFSWLEWKWIKQRPHFICYYMAKAGHDVTFFTTPYTGFKRRNKQFSVENSVDLKNLKIISRKVLPLPERISLCRRINKSLIEGILKEEYDIVILTHPMQYAYFKSIEGYKGKILYECMDNIPSLFKSFRRQGILEQLEGELSTEAASIVVSGDNLKDKLIKKYGVPEGKIHTVYNGFDRNTFLNTDAAVVSLKSPNLVFIGAILDWIDFELVKKFAEENKNITIYMVGPVHVKVKDELSKLQYENIIFTGAVEHSKVPSYIINSDILLMPFKYSESTKYMDPVKIYEYLYFKKPVVSFWSDEMDKFREFVYFYKDYNEFKNIIYNIFSGNLKPLNDIDEFIMNSDWEVRVDKYLKAVNSIAKEH